MKIPKLKRGEAVSVSKYEHQKLKRLYTQSSGTCGSVRNLVEASNLPVSKVRQFLHSRRSCTKLTPATRKFKRMKAFARFGKESWCMSLAYVDKIAKNKNVLKCLIVRQDLFDGTVDAEEKKTTTSKEIFWAFLSIVTKKNRQKKLVRQRNGICWMVQKICKTEGIQFFLQ